MKRVYTPDKNVKKISDILTELYLFKHALQTEDLVNLERRVDKVRSMLVDLQTEMQEV